MGPKVAILGVEAGSGARFRPAEPTPAEFFNTLGRYTYPSNVLRGRVAAREPGRFLISRHASPSVLGRYSALPDPPWMPAERRLLDEQMCLGERRLRDGES